MMYPSRELTYPLEVCCNEHNEMFPRRKNPLPGGSTGGINAKLNSYRMTSKSARWGTGGFPLQKELKRFSTVFFGFEVKHVVS